MTPSDSPLTPIWRLLDASFRVGRFFGTEVRVYGAWLIVLLLVAVPLESLAWLGWGDRLLYVGLGVVLLYAIVWLHEMGHVTAGRRYGIDTRLITLSPLGGLAHLQRAAPHPRADVVIALAGPATHLLVLAVAWPLSRLVGGEPLTWAFDAAGPGRAAGTAVHVRLEVVPFVLERLVELNVVMLLFNLLPFFPLDGGRALRSLLALRMHPNRATLIAARIGGIGALAGGVVGLFVLGGIAGGVLVSIAITNGFACRQAMLEARTTDGPYQVAREPWEEDAEAWKDGAAPEREAPRPRRRPVAPPPAKTGPDDAELDRLLDRVREVGLSGLSPAERDALQRASVARRSAR